MKPVGMVKMVSNISVETAGKLMLVMQEQADSREGSFKNGIKLVGFEVSEESTSLAVSRVGKPAMIARIKVKGEQYML